MSGMQDATITLIDLCHQTGNEHLVAHWDKLSPQQRLDLETQIRSIDFAQLQNLFSGQVEATDWGALADRAESPPAIRLHDSNAPFSPQQAFEAGAAALRAGKVAMVLVAGGQGTRLGFDLPKGMFPIGPVSNRTLFEMHVDSLRGAMRRYGVSIPLLIMTSPATDADTRTYFEQNNRLGLTESQLRIFQQGTMPAIDASTGKVLLESIDRIALSPDGHGGIVQALAKQGCFDFLNDQNIEYLFYLQVDNPLVTACDPLLLGYHILARSQMTTQVVRKRFAKEKVGNVVSIDGRTHIIEYSDLPDRSAERTLPDGTLALWAGNIAVHVFDVSFLASASNNDTSGLPFHLAKKAVPFVNASGETIKPATPNAIKFERFVFDLLPRAERTIVVEGDAAEVFAPVKNADGAPTDTPTATRAALVKLHRKWLEQAGVTIRDGVAVEINPLWAIDADEVRAKATIPATISVDTYIT